MTVEVGKERKILVRSNFFGSISLRAPDGIEFHCSSKRALAILAYLLLSGEEFVPRVRLQRLIWGQRYSENDQASLRRELYVLRMVFSSTKCAVFRSTRSAVGVNRAAFWVDGIDSPPSSTKGMTANAKKLLEELEGISVEFDNWIVGIRARIIPNT